MSEMNEMDDSELKVLVIEDDEDDFILIRSALAGLPHCRYALTWAGSGEAAFDALAHHAYDVCLLDYHLGEWNGLDLLKDLNARGLDLPVIFLTSFDDRRIDTDVMEAGATDYLVKDRFSAETLERSIRYAIKQKRIEGQLREKNLELSRLLGDLEERIGQRTAELRKACDSLLHLSKAVEQAGEAVVLLDTEGHIQYVNPAFEKITGYSRAEVIGEHIRLLHGEGQDERSYREIYEQLKSGQMWEGRIEELRKDGSLFCADTTFSPVFDGSGKVMSYVAIERDVTREAAMEARLRQAQRLEAIGVLSGGIAHDFNNILGAAILFTELAMDEVSPQSRTSKDLEEVLAACHRGKRLIEQMLTFSRSRDETYEPVPLSPVIKETIRFLRASLPADIEILSDFNVVSPDADTVLADPTQIHQMLLNLGANAAHAMRQGGGTLQVRLASVSSTSHGPEHHDLPPGRYLRLEVTDTGHGIAPEILDKIFTPYFTTKGAGEGSGMGLAVTFGIVRNHRGSIRAVSQPGKTSFEVYFPVLTSGAAEEPIESARGDERVLLVDDEPAILRAGVRSLQTLGYQVAAYSSPIDALGAFTARPEQFDLVITDLTMPHMSGTELAQSLSRIRPGIPIILCTGYGHRVDRKLAESRGIGQMLQKPVDRAVLARAVREALGG